MGAANPRCPTLASCVRPFTDRDAHHTAAGMPSNDPPGALPVYTGTVTGGTRSMSVGDLAFIGWIARRQTSLKNPSPEAAVRGERVRSISTVVCGRWVHRLLAANLGAPGEPRCMKPSSSERALPGEVMSSSSLIVGTSMNSNKTNKQTNMQGKRVHEEGTSSEEESNKKEKKEVVVEKKKVVFQPGKLSKEEREKDMKQRKEFMAAFWAAKHKEQEEVEKKKQEDLEEDMEGYEDAFEDDASCCSLSSDEQSLSERVSRASYPLEELMDELDNLPGTHKYLNGNTNFLDIGCLLLLCNKRAGQLQKQGYKKDAKQWATAALQANDQVRNLVIKYKRLKKKYRKLEDNFKHVEEHNHDMIRSIGEMERELALKDLILMKSPEKYPSLIMSENTKKEEETKKKEEELKKKEENTKRNEEVTLAEKASVTLGKTVTQVAVKKTYANAAKSRIDKIKEGGTVRHVVTVFHKDEKLQDSAMTQRALQKCVNPTKAGLRIKNVRKIGKGGVMIEGESKDDLEKLLKFVEELDTAGLTLKTPPKRKPRMVVYNTPCEEAEELLESIRLQEENEKMCLREHIKPITKIGKRNRDSYSWVIEVSREMRETLLENPKMYIGWTRCPVKDFISVSRCYRCQAFGHIAKHCRATVDTCGHCAEEGHTYKVCPKKEEGPSCINCKKAKRPFKHSSRSDECRAHTIARRHMVLNTDY